MAQSQDFQTTRGTVLATFAQGGTYSAATDLGGGWLMGIYSDNWGGAAGSVLFRASWSAAGTGYSVQTLDGTALKVLAFGSGTFYTLGHAPWNTAPLQYIRVEVPPSGTTANVAGGTMVLITGV